MPLADLVVVKAGEGSKEEAREDGREGRGAGLGARGRWRSGGFGRDGRDGRDRGGLSMLLGAFTG